MLPLPLLLYYSVQVQVPQKDKKPIKRMCHGAAAFTVNYDCVEIILFGGQNKNAGSFIADPVVLKFSKSIS